MTTSRRWWISFPFVLALAVLLFLGWSVSRALVYPQDGILSYYATGLISKLDPNGPAAGKLREGDVILSVDGVPVLHASPFYSNKHGGDEVEFVLQRNGQQVSASLRLIDPSPQEKLSRAMILIVALVFWIVGVGVLAFSPKDRSAELFFLFCQASSVLITSGSASYQGPSWIAILFGSLLWLISPLTLHFHLYFPQTAKFKNQTFLLIGLYGLAVLFGIPYLIFGIPAVRGSDWYPVISTGSLVYLAASLVGVVGLLFYAYRHAATAGVRGKIRIVVLGGVLSALPLITLTILPEALIQKPIISTTVAFLLLGILPITYGYAIVRHNLVEIDKHVNRGATYILVYSILGGFYLVLYAGVHNWLPEPLPDDPLVNTAIVMILASVFFPISQRVQRIVDSVFYGGWYDYRSAVTNITNGLEQITDLSSLGETISERLVRTLRLEEACVFLRDLDGVFSEIAVAPRSKLGERSPVSYPVLPKSSLTYLLKIGMVERNSLRRALSEVTLTPEERQLLDSEQVYLWVPIIGHGQVLGLLALGPKYGGDVFSGEDLDILRVVARHTSPLIENIHLVTRLKRHAAELERRVTERTAELYAAKERVEAILASVGDAVVVADLDWNVVTVNAAFEDQSGYSASEIVHHKIWDFVNVQEQRGLLDKIISTLEQGTVWTGDLSDRSKDGHLFAVQLTMSPVRDQDGQVVGYVGSQRDITRQKELEILKDRLIFDVSHELRTPVTNLNLYIELLERGRPEKRQDYLGVLKSESNRLIDLIESILDLSRLDMWKSRKVELSAVDLNQVSAQVIAAHRPLAESSGNTLIFQPERGLPRILGEQNQLARLITNLISNAIRYTPEGSIWLRTFHEDGKVGLLVEDTGIGIEPEDLHNIFDRFYRGRQVSQSKINGTGLGLAIVKEIVEIHEAKISVESIVCQGSKFTVLFPQVPAEV